jgi:malonyl-CoA/methylmalonyl-CoA synthetase
MALPDLLALATAAPSEFQRPHPRPDDLAAILYTSGTTGRSKGVMLSRDNLASNAEALVGLWRFTGADVFLHALPVFHTHGLFVATNCVLLSGSAMIFHRAFSPIAVLCRPAAGDGDDGGAYLLHPPSGRPRPDPATACAHVRLFISGSAPLSPATHAEWRTGRAMRSWNATG